MIQNKSILAIIPARGGSKSIPRKNICDLGGKPLIAWTIEAAKQSKYIDRLIVSSEDEEILRISKEWGADVPFVRPMELAQDDTPGIDPIIHAIQNLPEYDYVMVLQATSPFRIAEDIDGCVEFLLRSCKRSCVSVAEAEQNPYWMYFLDETNKMKAVLKNGDEFYQRQLLPKVYIMNGAIYIAERAFILENNDFVAEDTLGYVMSRDKSLDVDSKDDLEYAKSKVLVMKRGI